MTTRQVCWCWSSAIGATSTATCNGYSEADRAPAGATTTVASRSGVMQRRRTLVGMPVPVLCRPAQRQGRQALPFCRLEAQSGLDPQVINTDKNPAYGEAIAELKQEGAIPAELEHRQVKYLNNRLECDRQAEAADPADTRLPVDEDGLCHD